MENEMANANLSLQGLTREERTHSNVSWTADCGTGLLIPKYEM